jgi:hypothetical protein
MLKKISFIFLIVTVLLVFRKFFLPGPLVWGDAPYFYPNAFKELLTFPPAWITRGNTFGGVNLFLWIHPVMLIYGILGNLLHLNNDLILRMIFYFPSLIFAALGIWFLNKYLKFSKIVTFFSIFIYLVNTHYLLLIDGGQVGMVLSYGLFPLMLLFLIKVSDKLTIKRFLIALMFGFILTVVDFRISAICILTAILLKIPEPKKIVNIFLVSISILGISAYWIIPILSLSSNAIDTGISSLQTTSLLNSLFLFSPNWPANQFGQIISPYFYFGIVPILIFAGVFLRDKKKTYWLAFVFLIFAFLAKGTTYPMGNFYNFFISTKVGSVFRDSTKFFIPLLLLAGILIGISIEELVEKVKNNFYKNLLLGTFYLLILILVWPAIFGRLNGVLGKNPNLDDYQQIYRLISDDSNKFLRTAWFTEKSPFAFHTEEKQAIDAKDLINFRPFAEMNTGTGDKFNFINNHDYLDWFDLMGIKYLILNGNPRVIKTDKSDQEDWNRLNKLLVNDNRLEKVNVLANLPIYKLPIVHPNKFFVNKTFLVVGGDDIYQKFKNIDENFSVGNSGFLFVEDGKLDPSTLQNIASSSAILILNNKTKEDLTMAFLQKYFVGVQSASQSQWSRFAGKNYLDYKYELLTKDIKLNDFDYGLGIALSTIKGEKINFKLDIPDDGNYVLAVRKMNKEDQNLHWKISNLDNLKKGTFDYSYTNESGIEVLNAIALIPRNEIKAAEHLSDNFIGFFQHFDINNKSDNLKIKVILQTLKWQDAPSVPSEPGWIIFTDSYNPNWVIQRPSYEEFASYPFYSMVNGFYVKPEWGETKIIFKGREVVRWGIYWSVISVLLIIIIVLWLLHTA